MEKKYLVDTEDLYGLVMESAQALLEEKDSSDLRTLYSNTKSARKLEEMVKTNRTDFERELKSNPTLLNEIRNLKPAPRQ